MLSRKEQCFLALLGAAALTQYHALQNDAPSIEPAQSYRQYSDRTDALLDEWRKLRPEAEMAAQFYDVDDTLARKRRRRVDPGQLQFFEEPLFATAAYFRRAAADAGLLRAEPQRLVLQLEDEPERWLRIFRAQRGRWDGNRALEIDQAIAALEFFTAVKAGRVRASDWFTPEVSDDYYVVGHRPGELDLEVGLRNPNPVDAPVLALAFVLLAFGRSALIRWPSVSVIPAQTTVRAKVTIPFVEMNCEIEHRFAHSHEMYGPH